MVHKRVDLPAIVHNMRHGIPPPATDDIQVQLATQPITLSLLERWGYNYTWLAEHMGLPVGLVRTLVKEAGLKHMMKGKGRPSNRPPISSSPTTPTEIVQSQPITVSLLERWEYNYTYLAEHMQLPIHVVRKMVKEAGLNHLMRSKGRPTIPQPTITQQLIVDCKYSLRGIASYYNVSKSTARKWLIAQDLYHLIEHK